MNTPFHIPSSPYSVSCRGLDTIAQEAERIVLLKIKRLHPDALIPQYATEGSACFDLSIIRGGAVGAYASAVFDTGLAFEIPLGWMMQIFSRSGHGFKNDVRLSNCVGVIDADYRGQVRIKLRNDGPLRFDVKAGERIAQGLLVPVTRVGFYAADELGETARGAGGFGSTGGI